MSLKIAVYEITGDELAAEIPVPVPVEVTCHALCAQITALPRIQARIGHLFVHSTVNRRKSLDARHASGGGACRSGSSPTPCGRTHAGTP